MSDQARRVWRAGPATLVLVSAFALTAGGLAAEPEIGQVSAAAARSRRSARRLTKGQRIESMAG